MSDELNTIEAMPEPQNPVETPPDHPYPGEDATKPESIDISVDQVTAFNLKVQEFDKNIAEAKAVVADLNKQKATFIYETNVQAIVAKAKQQETSEQTVSS